MLEIVHVFSWQTNVLPSFLAFSSANDLSRVSLAESTPAVTDLTAAAAVLETVDVGFFSGFHFGFMSF